MNNQKNNVVVFDLDGTLLSSNNTIIGGKTTLECLKTLEEMGCILTICTGRLDHDIIKITQQHGLDMKHRISQNGAVLNDECNVQAILLDKLEAIQIYHHIQSEPVRIELNTISNRYWKEERDPSFPKELYDSHLIRSDFEEICTCLPTVLFLVIGEEHVLHSIERYVNDNFVSTTAIKTSMNSLEILHKDASKGKAIKRLYPNDTIYAIGDSPNDFGMFPIAKKGYLVSPIECDFDCIRKPSITEALQDIIHDIQTK